MHAIHTIWVYLTGAKGKALILVPNFVAMVKTQFRKYVKVFRSANGQEFLSWPMK